MKKKLLCLALASAISLAAQAADKVKVGFVSTLSGPGGVLGVAIRDGFQLGIEHAGGKLGGLPVEVLIEDDQQKPDVAKQLAEKLIKRDKVDFMTGIVFQNILQAAQATVLGAETYYVSPNTGPSDLAGAGCNPYFFAVSWVSDSYSEATGKNMTDKGYKNVFVIAPNYPGGKDVVNGFKRYYKGNYAGEAYTKLGQLDYAVEISQMRAAKPDAVFFFLPGGMGVNFLKQWQQAGMNKDFPLFGTGWSFDQDTLAAVGEPTLGALNTSHWNLDLDNAANKKFVADFEKKYGRLPNEFAAQGYDAPRLTRSVWEACQRGGGARMTPAEAAGAIRTVAHVLKIGWVAEALDVPAQIICPRSAACPRAAPCAAAGSGPRAAGHGQEA